MHCANMKIICDYSRLINRLGVYFQSHLTTWFTDIKNPERLILQCEILAGLFSGRPLCSQPWGRDSIPTEPLGAFVYRRVIIIAKRYY